MYNGKAATETKLNTHSKNILKKFSKLLFFVLIAASRFPSKQYSVFLKQNVILLSCNL